MVSAFSISVSPPHSLRRVLARGSSVIEDLRSGSEHVPVGERDVPRRRIEELRPALGELPGEQVERPGVEALGDAHEPELAQLAELRMKAHRDTQDRPLALIGLESGTDEPAEGRFLAREAAEIHEESAARVEQRRRTGHDVGGKPPISRERPDRVVPHRLVEEAPAEVAEVSLEAHTPPAREILDERLEAVVE